MCVFYCGQWRWQQHNKVPPRGLSPVHAGCDLAGALSGPAVATGPVSSLSSQPRAGSGSHCGSATCCRDQFCNFLQNLAWREQGASTTQHYTGSQGYIHSSRGRPPGGTPANGHPFSCRRQLVRELHRGGDPAAHLSTGGALQPGHELRRPRAAALPQGGQPHEARTSSPQTLCPEGAGGKRQRAGPGL